MCYRYLKNLPRRAVSDKVLRDKAFNIDKNPKYNGYQHLFQRFKYLLMESLLQLILQVMLLKTNLCQTNN